MDRTGKERLKQHITRFLLVCFAATTLIFGALWNKERNDKSEILLLAQASASDAYAQFSTYQRSGENSDYWHAVSAFRSFQQAYYLLVKDTNKVPNYVFCNEVYGSLILAPERSQTHISEITETMALLAENVEDENGYLLMGFAA